MAIKNRDEIKVLINALTAIYTEVAYKDMLADQIVDNLVFRKKVTGAQGGSGAIAVDYDGKDYIELTLAGNATITFSNIELGEEKVLKVVKTGGQTIAFSGADDQTPDADNVTALTSIYYLVYKKDTGANIVVEPISKTFGAASETAKGIAELATTAEVAAGTDDEKIVTPAKLGGIFWKKIQITNWNMSTSATKTISVPGILASKVIHTSAFIQNDANGGGSPLIIVHNEAVANGTGEINVLTDEVLLLRFGTLWSSGYSGTGNRGYLLLGLTEVL